MIGNETDARAALDANSAMDYTNLLSADGSTRFTYLINGVVYKVDIGGFEENVVEYARREELSRVLPPFVRIPEMSIYSIGNRNVLAAEYIVGTLTGECMPKWFDMPCECDGRCMSDALISNLVDIGWTDCAWGNAIVADGVYYLVDIAT